MLLPWNDRKGWAQEKICQAKGSVTWSHTTLQMLDQPSFSPNALFLHFVWGPCFFCIFYIHNTCKRCCSISIHEKVLDWWYVRILSDINEVPGPQEEKRDTNTTPANNPRSGITHVSLKGSFWCFLSLPYPTPPSCPTLLFSNFW